jgi:hypothetical protein
VVGRRIERRGRRNQRGGAEVRSLRARKKGGRREAKGKE